MRTDAVRARPACHHGGVSRLRPRCPRAGCAVVLASSPSSPWRPARRPAPRPREAPALPNAPAPARSTSAEAECGNTSDGLQCPARCDHHSRRRRFGALSRGDRAAWLAAWHQTSTRPSGRHRAGSSTGCAPWASPTSSRLGLARHPSPQTRRRHLRRPGRPARPPPTASPASTRRRARSPSTSPSCRPPIRAADSAASARHRAAHRAAPAERPQPWDLEGLRVRRTPTHSSSWRAPRPGSRARPARRGRGAAGRRRVGTRRALGLGRARHRRRRGAPARPDPPGDAPGRGRHGRPARARASPRAPTASWSSRGLGRPERSGRDVVLTHELTHATVRASTTRAVPDWLAEGFAEFVAYDAVALPEREARRAGARPRARARVCRRRCPRTRTSTRPPDGCRRHTDSRCWRCARSPTGTARRRSCVSTASGGWAAGADRRASATPRRSPTSSLERARHRPRRPRRGSGAPASPRCSPREPLTAALRRRASRRRRRSPS